jgi:hypothetical protein
MRDRYTAFLGRVLELHMTALVGDFEPSIPLKNRDDLPAMHGVYCYTSGHIVNPWIIGDRDFPDYPDDDELLSIAERMPHDMIASMKPMMDL